MREEGGYDVGEEGQGQPFENLEDGAVGDKQLHADDEDRDRDDQPQTVDGTSRQQCASGGDRSQVGADIERIGDQQPEDSSADQPSRELPPQADPETDSGVQGDPGAEFLYRAHQREGEERGPEQTVAKLAADLRVGPDAAGV